MTVVIFDFYAAYRAYVLWMRRRNATFSECGPQKLLPEVNSMKSYALKPSILDVNI
jgi:hypothetical protein